MSVSKQKLVDFGCTGCARRFRLGRAALINQLLRRSTCQYCGAQLDVPADVVPELLEQQRRGEAPRRELRGNCLSCLHVTRGEGPVGEPVAVRCRGCGLPYLLVDTGARLPKAPEAVQATELQQAVVGLEQIGEQVTARVLQGRAAAGEVAAGEAAWVAARLSLVRQTPPADVDLLLPRSEAALVLRDLLARMPTALLGSGGSYVSFRQAQSDALAQARNDPNLRALAAELLLPAGHDAEELHELFDAAGDVSDRGPKMLEVKATLTETRRGTRLSWSRGAAGQRLTPIPAETEQTLRREIHARLGNLAPYFRRIALYGRSSEGHPALMVNPDAARARLQLLGVRPDPAIIEQYRLVPQPLPLPFVGV